MLRPHRLVRGSFASVLACVFAIGLGGCATLLAPSHDFSLSVTNLLPTEASLLETTAVLTLRLTNEMPRPVTLVGGVHRLMFNGTYVGRAVTNERITVPQLGTLTQTVTVHLENLTLMRKLAELSRDASPTIRYQLDSKLHPAEGEGLRSFDATTRGELDVGELMNGASKARE